MKLSRFFKLLALRLSGDRQYHHRAKEIFEESQLEGRARNSVEVLLTQF